MRSPLALRIAFAAAVIAPVVVLGQAGSQKPSDLAGVWTRGGGDGGGPMSQWSSKPVPFSAAGLAKFNANKPGKGPRQGPPALGNDPIGDANPPS